MSVFLMELGTICKLLETDNVKLNTGFITVFHCHMDLGRLILSKEKCILHFECWTGGYIEVIVMMSIKDLEGVSKHMCATIQVKNSEVIGDTL